MSPTVNAAFKALSPAGQRAYNADGHSEDPTGRKGTPVTNQKLLDGFYKQFKS